jgi:predicted SprT family Zn-dependent metalloprotease
MQAEALKIRARCGEMVEKIKTLYGMDLSRVQISFDLRGKSAGKAGGRGYRMPGHAYWVKFNRDMLTREAFEHVINNTVPHEYAHVVCYMDPNRGKNHDHGWARVCRELGGSGARSHNEEVVYGKGLTYEYTTDRGHKVRESEKKHKYVQGGGALRWPRGMGSVNRLSDHSIVGHRGKTLAVPIVKQGPNSPAAIERSVIDQRIAEARAVGPAALLLAVQPAPPTVTRAPHYAAGQSKAAISRSIMLSGYRGGHSYEQIINAMVTANGYERQLARATFKANAAKVGIPEGWGQ